MGYNASKGEIRDNVERMQCDYGPDTADIFRRFGS
jgi:hypothetical protein